MSRQLLSSMAYFACYRYRIDLLYIIGQGCGGYIWGQGAPKNLKGTYNYLAEFQNLLTLFLNFLHDIRGILP